MVWIDGEKLIDADTTGKALSLRQGGIEECAPFGLATWETTARIKDIHSLRSTYLTGMNPVFWTTACPAGESTKSTNDLASAEALSETYK